MIQTKGPVVNGRHFHYTGIHQARASNDQEDLFRAYQSFACHHTINDADMYENAASLAPLSGQKILFLGLAGCKRAVVQKLKMNGADNSVSFSSQRNTSVCNLTRYFTDLDTTPLITPEDAFNLAYWRENKTMLLYEKLLKTASLPSIKKLFDYLIESQREHLAFITQQLVDGWEVVTGHPSCGSWFLNSGDNSLAKLAVN